MGRGALSSVGELASALQLDFSDEQLAAICAPLEPGVIIAGAGTGKTTVMAARVVWLVGTGQVRPDEVLGLTFTRKAAAELAGRVRDALERGGVLTGEADEGQEVVMTYDAFAARLVAEHGLRMGIETDPTIITGASRYRLASRVVTAAEGPFESLSRLRPGSITDRFLTLDSDLASHLVSTHQLRVHTAGFLTRLEGAPLNNRGNVYASVRTAHAMAVERLDLAGLVDDYQRLKRDLGLVEFADQLAMAARLVDAVPSVPGLLRRQFRVVLLDEYQDTSSAQAELLRALFGGGHPVTAVGDPFQAIYGWRGAAASNITSFPSDFPNETGRPAASYQLTVNRRSHQQILDVGNDIGDGLRAAQRGKGVAAEPLVAPPGRHHGVVLALGFETASDEVAWLAESVADLGRDPDVDWSETAILVRRNADIPPLFTALVERDVPVEIVGLGGLLELPEIAAVIATLSLLDDVTANADLAHLLTGPRWGIGLPDMEALGRRARALAAETGETACLVDAVVDPGEARISSEARARLRQFASEFGYLQRHAGEAVPDLTRRVIATLGLEVELAVGSSGVLRDQAAQVARFVDAVTDYVDVDGDASLGGLLGYLQAELDHGVGLDQAVPTDANSVKLMTVHKAKGLEWERVYLPGLADKVFPSDRVSDNHLRNAAVIPAPLRGDALSIPQVSQVTDGGFQAYGNDLKLEQRRAEDRLAYVAVTRAKSVLIGSWHVWSPGLARPRNVSPYYQAIERGAERQSAVLRRAAAPGHENPTPATDAVAPWPPQPDEETIEQVRRAAAWVRLALAGRLTPPPLSLDHREVVASWDADLEALLVQAAETDSAIVDVVVPESLSVTGVAQLRRDAQGWAAEAVRPMPRPPSPAAELGRRFHEWVQRRSGLVPLFDDEAGARETDVALERLKEAFERGPYADLTPVAVEAPFVAALNGHLIRGRIDAVYPGSDGFEWQVVDWKTSGGEPDPLQLAIYRRAWADAQGVPASAVDAVFYNVRTGAIVRPPDLDTLA